MTILIGIVHKVNEHILCRGFLFLLQRKTKAQLQHSHCRSNKSRKCEAVQKSPFWIIYILCHTVLGASYVFIGLPSERKRDCHVNSLNNNPRIRAVISKHQTSHIMI